MSECIVAIDPGASGGFCQFVDGKAVWAWKYTTFSDFVADILDLRENPDHSLEIVLEDVPPFAGKNIPSSTGFKLGKKAWPMWQGRVVPRRSASSRTMHLGFIRSSARL